MTTVVLPTLKCNRRPLWFGVRRRSFLVVIGLLALGSAGCEKSEKFGSVRGTVTMDGKPLDMVRVLFIPVPDAKNEGAYSDAITDKEGGYQLVYSRDLDVKGAIVGPHSVVVVDIAAEESRDKFIPMRVPDAYQSPARTPLKFEVQEGEQTFDIAVGKSQK